MHCRQRAWLLSVTQRLVLGRIGRACSAHPLYAVFRGASAVFEVRPHRTDAQHVLTRDGELWHDACNAMVTRVRQLPAWWVHARHSHPMLTRNVHPRRTDAGPSLGVGQRRAPPKLRAGATARETRQYHNKTKGAHVQLSRRRCECSNCMASKCGCWYQTEIEESCSSYVAVRWQGIPDQNLTPQNTTSICDGMDPVQKVARDTGVHSDRRRVSAARGRTHRAGHWSACTRPSASLRSASEHMRSQPPCMMSKYAANLQQHDIENAAESEHRQRRGHRGRCGAKAVTAPLRM
jgi:hypothetical protein